MQFTELSELNRVIGLMRDSSCNSPTFHDRHDSEVDRIYNSSPKMEMQLRNSWIDRMAAMKLPGTPKKGAPPSTGKSMMMGTLAGSMLSSTKDGAGSSVIAGKNRGKGAAAASIKTSDKASNGKKEDAKETGGGTEDKSSGDAANKAKSDGFDFTREEVEPLPALSASSLLDRLLNGAAVPMGPKTTILGGDGGAVLHLTIYLPTRKEMKMDLYDVSTVEEAIQELLRTHQAEGHPQHLYYGHPECYELRLHDSDGYPDEDFPALDRSRKIKNFGDAGGHEYCLCERPEACPPTGDAMPDSGKPASVVKTEAISSVPKTPGANDKIFLKIRLPKNDDYTVVAVDGTTTGQDLLPALNKKHRLQLFQDQYVLKISEADRERLDLASDEIDMYTKLRPLNIHEATLSTKQYADAPQIPVTITPSVEEVVNVVDSRTRPPPETFMFNDVTAGMFKEWQVDKKNKYGKWQRRMFGVDLNKVYNRKVGERVIKSRNTTKVAERPMSSIEAVRFMQDPSGFQIHFKDSIEEIVTDYTAESPYECAEIVAKLKYILSRRKQ